MRRPKLGTFHGTGWLNEGSPMSGTLKVWQERIDISTDLPKPDPAWTFVDAAGHFHARSGDSYPTLSEKLIDVPCDGTCGNWDCDGSTLTEWSCVLCSEVVKPGKIAGPHYESMPGRYDWSAALEGSSTPELERLAMGGGFSDRFVLRFNAVSPEPWTFFGVVGANGGTISGGVGDWVTVSVLLYAAGELGDRPLVKELTK